MAHAHKRLGKPCIRFLSMHPAPRSTECDRLRENWESRKRKVFSCFYVRILLDDQLKLDTRHFWASLAVCLIALNLWYFSKANWTSNGGSNYCCRWVGRGIQPLFIAQPPPHTQTRIAHGQRFPMPCLEWSAEEVEWEQGSAAAPKGRCPVGHRGEFPDVLGKHI